MKMILEQESLFSLEVVILRWFGTDAGQFSHPGLLLLSWIIEKGCNRRTTSIRLAKWKSINNIMLGRRVEVSITKCVSYGHTAARSCVHRCELLTLPRLTAHGAHLRTDDLERNIRYLVRPSIKGTNKQTNKCAFMAAAANHE